MNYNNLISKKMRGLVDCDSFFASCEILKNPDLEGKPMAVGRDIIVAATYEAKAYGIKTGTPVWEAEKLCPQIIIVPPDITFYGRISENLMDFLDYFCNEIEVFSIDEAFINLTGLNKKFGLSYQELALKLQNDIKKQIGIPVSIGISNTKLIAKIFSPINKPYGVFVENDPFVLDQVFKKIHIKRIPFIGEKSAEKLVKHASNIYEFKSLSYETVKECLGGNGIKLWFELNGVQALSLGHNDYPKGISRTRSFNPDFIMDRNKLWEHMIFNFERAFEELTILGMKVKYLKVSLRKKDFNKYKCDIVLPQHISDKKLLLYYLKNMFNKIYKDGIWYRGTGVSFGDLKKETHIQTALFPQKEDKYAILREVINKLNQKFGRFVISSATNVIRKPKIGKDIKGIVGTIN